MAGSRVAVDRYRRLALLGEGGSGKVWLVEDALRPGSRVALKELADSARDNTSSLRSEFITLASLRHPSLVEVQDFDVDPNSGRPRFSMEFIDGSNLVAAATNEPPHVLIEFIAESLRALSFLHDFGWIHRDLKPGNLLVRKHPRNGCRVVILDFGLALQGRSEDHAPLAGTLPYIAPEILGGAEPSYRSDLYSVAVVAHEALYGAPPFVAPDWDLARLIELKSRGLATSPALPDSWPPKLAAWLARLLDPDPTVRPATSAEALAAFNAACDTNYPLDLPSTRAARLASGAPPGRSAEVESIWQALSPNGEPRVVFLTGDAGSGKTRILRWVKTEAIRQGWNTISNISMRGEGNSPDSVDALLHEVRDSATRQPTLVALDEVETADTATALFLERVVGDRGSPPVQVVAALRSSEIGNARLRRLISLIEFFPTARRVDLSPMTESAVRQVVARVSGGADVPTGRVSWLLEASEGNPLQLESLIVDAAWETGATIRGHRTLEASIAKRVNSLEPTARDWLTVLAVLGPDSPQSLIERVSDVSPRESQRIASEVAALGLAHQAVDRWSLSSRWVATHLLENLETDELRELSKRAATVVSEDTDDAVKPERNARLWRQAGSPEESLKWAIQASARAEHQGEASDAADWLRYALEQLGRRDSRRVGLRERHAELLSRADRHREAARAFAATARMSADIEVSGRLRTRQARALIYSGKFHLASRIAQGVKTLAVSRGLDRLQAIAATEVGAARLFCGNDTEAIRTLEEAEKIFQRLGEDTSRATALHFAGLAYSRMRRFQDARRCYDGAFSLLRDGADDGLKANVLLAMGVLEERASHGDRACEIYSKARRFLDGRNLLRQSLTLLINMANGHLRSGRFDHVVEPLQEAESLALRLGNRNGLIQCRASRAEALARCGRPAEAVGILNGILRGPLVGFDRSHVAYARISIAEAQLEDPNPPLEEIAKHLGPLLNESVWDPRVALAALLIEMERRARTRGREPVRPIWDRYLRIVEETGIPPDPPFEVRRRLALARSLIETDPAEARSLGQEARAIAEEKDLPALAARSCALLAEVVRREGDDRSGAMLMERARKLLADAAERIDDPDMRRDFLDRHVFAAIRESRTAAEEAGEKRLLAIYDMIRVLNSETDPDYLLESMLDMALAVVRAERGMILLREESEGEFSVRVARNLEHETIRDAAEFSHNVVLRAGSGRSVLAVDTGQDERLRELKSVSLFGIRSVLCVPLRSRGTIIGAVYLDSRTAGRLFTPDDLRFLEAFADHAALALQNARVRSRLERTNERLRVAAEARTSLGELVGASAPMQRVYDLITKVAPSDLPVLIQGASGTGKELVAREIHRRSTRSRKPYLTENCAAVAETLLESELFGHVKGAFTGAERDRTGLFEQADGGTLFLDEVGDMSPNMQARLLRVLQEGELRRVGGNERIRVDVRILAATHHDLDRLVREGRFREDLLYRLQVLVIPLPTLRERPGDVSPLVQHLLGKIAESRGEAPATVTPRVMELLERGEWPGNVRQLENALQRLVLLAGGEPIDAGMIEGDPGLRDALLGDTVTTAPVFSLAENERERIRDALRVTEGHRARAAKLLGISRATIFRKIKEFGID